MPSQERRERALAERSALIVRAARELAEADGWDAVTTRRLAEAVEYSQPVLYSHFKNMQAIVTAVALDGMAELAVVLRSAREADGIRGLADAYLGYAEAHPAVYAAIFTRRTDLVFGAAESPEILKTTFGELHAAVAPYASGDAETLTEVFWSAMHGQATLNHDRRLRPAQRTDRIEQLVRLVTG
ncbi:TetR/AcrR family transcriptional regulator [Kribbella albertanoniae]|uniref:TetR/AcrR family transcriptional regulator n=1 Tax=Kribbella albertanoniae TaxID=1266829 RepID=A0A4R4Q5L2_9ACTN|nr:TetR/AcrR family transcriptional regulator [Kribbella albertanoniae]TDC30407.1 TetR/AcrR family transcriptional regulator [Kribbella albertanoniae]